METVLLVVHLMIAIAMVGVVLMQQSEGGALGMGGGSGAGGGFLTGRGTANLLTRTTAMLAAAFFMTSILLTIFARHEGGGSVFDASGEKKAPQETTTTQKPAKNGAGNAPTAKTEGPAKPEGSGGVLDALKSGQGHAPLPAIPQSQ